MGAEGWRFICSPGRRILRDPRARPPVKPNLDRTDDARPAAGAAGAGAAAAAAGATGAAAAGATGAGAAAAGAAAGGAGADIVKKADIYY